MIHLCVEFHNRDACHRVSCGDRSLDRRRAAPARQQRTVDIEHTFFGKFEEPRWKNFAIRDYDKCIACRAYFPQPRDEGFVFKFFRLVCQRSWQRRDLPRLDEDGFYRRRGDHRVTSDRPIWLCYQTSNLESRIIHYRLERWHRKFRCAEKDKFVHAGAQASTKDLDPNRPSLDGFHHFVNEKDAVQMIVFMLVNNGREASGPKLYLLSMAI